MQSNNMIEPNKSLLVFTIGRYSARFQAKKIAISTNTVAMKALTYNVNRTVDLRCVCVINESAYIEIRA